MDNEHDCRYAKVIRTQPEWIEKNGEELCAFCHSPRFIKVTKTNPIRKAK
jgi:hypothetical protein